MTRKVLLSALSAVIISAFFIPVSQQKSILIKSSFLNTYSFLNNPVKWEHWRPELRKTIETDSNKISVQTEKDAFRIKDENFEIKIKASGNFFDINERRDAKSINYTYALIPVDDKFLNKTIISSGQKISVISYLTGLAWPTVNSDNHLSELKNFMETDSLLYGFNIIKTAVPESNLIVMRKEVKNQDKFTEAGKMQSALREYVKVNHLKQVYPVIAQYLPNGADSTQVNVGFYIDKEVPSANGIIFTRMPKGGPLLAAAYKGQFSKRGKAYSALKQYFSNHAYQAALLPFETYLDNKLPGNDNDVINIEVNFPTFPNGKTK